MLDGLTTDDEFAIDGNGTHKEIRYFRRQDFRLRHDEPLGTWKTKLPEIISPYLETKDIDFSPADSVVETQLAGSESIYSDS